MVVPGHPGPGAFSPFADKFAEAAIKDDREDHAMLVSSQRSRLAAAGPLIEMIRRPDH